jgi:hypothetical protein
VAQDLVFKDLVLKIWCADEAFGILAMPVVLCSASGIAGEEPECGV